MRQKTKKWSSLSFGEPYKVDGETRWPALIDGQER